MQSVKRTRREISRLVLMGTISLLMVGLIAGCVTDLTELKEEITNINNRVTSIDNRVASIDNSVTEIDNRVTNIDNRVTQIEKTIDPEKLVNDVMDEICHYNVNVVFYDWAQMDKGQGTSFGQFVQALDIIGKGKVDANGNYILTVRQSRSEVIDKDLSRDINHLAIQSGVDVDWAMGTLGETCAFDTQLANLEYVPTQVQIEGVDKAEVEIKLVVDKLLEGSHIMLEPTSNFRNFAVGLDVKITKDGNPFTGGLYDSIEANENIEITMRGEVTKDSLQLLQQGMRVYAMTARVRQVGGKSFSVVTYSYFDVTQPRAVIFGQKIPVVDPTNQPACYPGNDISDTRFRDLILQVSGRNCV